LKLNSITGIIFLKELITPPETASGGLLYFQCPQTAGALSEAVEKLSANFATIKTMVLFSFSGGW